MYILNILCSVVHTGCKKTKNALQSFSALTDIVLSQNVVLVYWRRCFNVVATTTTSEATTTTPTTTTQGNVHECNMLYSGCGKTYRD